MASIENEAMVEHEIGLLEKDEEALKACYHIMALVDRMSKSDPAELSAVEEGLDKLWNENPRLLIEMLMLMLGSTKFSQIDDHVHHTLCVVLSVYISKYALDSENNEHASILVSWLNRMSYAVFRCTQTEKKTASACLPFTKLFLFFEFFVSPSFSEEVYFRFVKKHFADCSTEDKLSNARTNLAKLLVFLEIVVKEDSRILTSTLPKLLNESVSALSLCCSNLFAEFSAERGEQVLFYLQRINTTMMTLLLILRDDFGKYSSQALDALTNRELSQHLQDMNKFVEQSPIKSLPLEQSLALRSPMVTIVSVLVTIDYRFHVEARNEAQKYREQIEQALQRYDLSKAHQTLQIWINRAMGEMIELGQSIGPSDPPSAREYYHQSLELMARSIEVTALSLDLQREADSIFLKVVCPTIISFDIGSVSRDTLAGQYEAEKDIYRQDNYDSIISCSVSLLMQIIDHCSLSNRVVDFLDQLANDILDKKRMTADNLSLFLPKRQVSAEEKVKGFLVIFNSCAKKFSKHDSLKQVIVDFYEQHYFNFFDLLKHSPGLLYRLVFLTRNSLLCLEFLSGSSFLALFKNLISLSQPSSPDGQAPANYPEQIIDLSFEILGKFISTKNLALKLRVHVYDTLSCFDGLLTYTHLSYFNFIDQLLGSQIRKEYSRYAAKILAFIIIRIEKEYVNCVRSCQPSNIIVSHCMKLISSLLAIPQLLEEGYEGIEKELAKFFQFLATEKVDFASEILDVASSVVRAAGCHLAILDPVTSNFERIYHMRDHEMTDLYEVFYSYILKDSNFVLNEVPAGHRTSLGEWVEEEKTKSMLDQRTSDRVTPFKSINNVLNQILIRTASDQATVHISTLKKALLLIMLEFQIWNEARLISTFQEVLVNLFKLLRFLEGQFENKKENTEETIFIAYIWTVLAIMNIFHYYYEQVREDIINEGLLHRFVNKGAELIAKVYPSLPKVLKKIFQVALIRTLSNSASLELSIDAIVYLINLICASLFEDIPQDEASSEMLLDCHAKISKFKKLKNRGKLGNKAEASNGVETISMKTNEETLASYAGLAPNHKVKDFYISSINVFTYFQSTFNDLKKASNQFVDTLRETLAPDQIKLLNDILSVKIIDHTTTLVPEGPTSHIMHEERSKQHGVRIIAKLARRQPQEQQSRRSGMMNEQLR